MEKEKPKFAKEFTESLDLGWGNIGDFIKKNHPREYHITFKDLRSILKKVGFKKIKIIPSPCYLAIVIAEK